MSRAKLWQLLRDHNRPLSALLSTFYSYCPPQITTPVSYSLTCDGTGLRPAQRAVKRRVFELWTVAQLRRLHSGRSDQLVVLTGATWYQSWVTRYLDELPKLG
jgi:hypothetical protein